MGIRGKIIIQIFMRRSDFTWNINLKLSQRIPRKVISRVAIEKLVEGLDSGKKKQVLLGATGDG